MPPPNSPIFSEAEIEKMRLFVTEHDKRASVNTFDLNNPPREAYVHQDFPRLVYNHDLRTYKKVDTAEELSAALADGWKKEQFAAETEDPALDPTLAAEVVEIDKRVAAERKKKK